MVVGEKSTCALVAEGSKGQPSVGKSSGETELKAIDEIVKLLTNEPTTELEVQLFKAAAPKTKAAVGTVTRIGYPVLALLQWLTENRSVNIDSRYMHVDASVAIAVTQAGSSKALAYITKTQAVDLRFLDENLRLFGFRLRKCSTKVNTSDIFTKAVSAATLRDMLPLIGRGNMINR